MKMMKMKTRERRFQPRSAGSPAGAARGGFTILEIMIATAILTVGLVGILALFPVAIHTGKQIIEKSMSVVVAESVAEAIREGIRNNLRTLRRGSGEPHAYFILRHDGVLDEIPVRKELELPSKDYFILLPRFRPRAQFPNRDTALRLSKTFVFPETDSSPNGNGDALLADDDGDDFKREFSDGQVVNEIRVEKTYSLGNSLPGLEATGENVLDDQKIELIKQYSFAFWIQSSKFDANLSQNESVFEPANRLYVVKVMVYHGFKPPGSGVPTQPVFELDFEVAL